MALVLVTGMPLEPHTCVTCGGGGRDAEGNIQEVVFAEAVDINWGDSVYVCHSCAGIIANLIGYVGPDVVADYDRQLEELSEIDEKYRELKQRVKKMLQGQRARKEVKDAA